MLAESESEQLLMAFWERVLLERLTADVPGADWEAVIREGQDALIRELGAQDVTPAFVSELLAELRRRFPGQWPAMLTAAAVKKRIQRLRPPL
jgi:hypothetical protein